MTGSQSRVLAGLARGVAAATALLLGVVSAAQAGPVVRRASGANSAAIQATVDQFRADLGGGLNGVGGNPATGRREINWDGVPDTAASPNVFPGDFFNVTSARGAVLTTPGTGFQVSGTPARFGNFTSPTPPSSPPSARSACSRPWGRPSPT